VSLVLGGATTVEQRSDHNLVQSLREQDTAAFEILFARYQEPVRQHLSHIVRDPNTAEDLTQEVFLRVWTRAEQWDGRGAFKAWALRIATNLALNHLRTVRRRRELPLEPPPDIGRDRDTAPTPDWLIDTITRRPEQVLEQLEWRERLQRLLRQLSEEKREVFHLVHDAEMDVREVAQSLGIPEGTVRSRLYYARKQLAREWNSEWEEL
jgi:RNA polymerase sigma-70 factor (ECF subfamily)